MKQIMVKRISADKKSVSVVENGLTISYRTMDIEDDRKMFSAISHFQRKYNVKARDIEFVYDDRELFEKSRENKEDIGMDERGRKMELYHYNNEVFCDHSENGKCVLTRHIRVDDRVRIFNAPHTNGAYIYDEIYRIYGQKL